MKVSKLIISMILTCGLVVGLITIGVLVNPVKVEAEDASTIINNSFSDTSGTFNAINIPAKLEVNNITTAANGESAHIPAFDAYIVAKPLTDASDRYHPYDFETGDFPGGGKWISGKFSLTDSSATFGEDKIYEFNSASFGYYDSWFAGKTGMYRYQIFLYDDTSNSFGGMFTLPDMTQDSNKIFLDFYLDNGTVNGVVLVDKDNNKLVSNNTSLDSTITSTSTKPTIGAGTTIKYNVADVTISNSIIDRNGRNSPFHYTAVFDNNLAGGAKAFDTINFTSGTATYKYESNTRQYAIDEKYGDFDCTILNCPVGLNLTVTQISPPDAAGKLLVYAAPKTKIDVSGYHNSTWTADVASAQGYANASSQVITVDATNSDTTNKVSFINVAVVDLPPTGINLTVLPFIILMGLALLLLAIFSNRKDKEV